MIAATVSNAYYAVAHRQAEAVGTMQPIAHESRLDLRQVRVSGVR
jgi:hypothetical protein